MTLSDQRLVSEPESRLITTIVLQCQLWLYGHEARYQEGDPACQVISERNHLGWKRPRSKVRLGHMF